MFIDGNKEENANGAAIWLDGPETTLNNDFRHRPSLNPCKMYPRAFFHVLAASIFIFYFLL